MVQSAFANISFLIPVLYLQEFSPEKKMSLGKASGFANQPPDALILRTPFPIPGDL